MNDLEKTVLFVLPHSMNEPTAYEDPNFEVHSSIKHPYLKISISSLKMESDSNSIHYINKMTKI